MTKAVGIALSLVLSGCAAPPMVSSTILHGTDGRMHDMTTLIRESHVVVVTFFSPTCPCQSAHDARLIALAERYRGLGVTFVSVDSEADATNARDVEEAKKRGYPFPILTDPEGALARAFDADVATYSVVLDNLGIVKFRGGIDSDWKELSNDATPWLENAIESVLRGDGRVLDERRALGCSLRKK